MESSSSLSNSSESRHLEGLLQDLNKIKKTKQKQNKIADASDTVNAGMKDIYKSLTILADKVVAKLNEILKQDLPDGIQSLDPEQHTAEATAQRIVDGTTALLPVYAKQHPELKGEELLKSFMEVIRSGIKQGYDEASAILGDIGALKIDGVQSGIKETMRLVEEKLKLFEENYLKSTNPPTAKQNAVEKSSSDSEGTSVALA